MPPNVLFEQLFCFFNIAAATDKREGDGKEGLADAARQVFLIGLIS